MAGRLKMQDVLYFSSDKGEMYDKFMSLCEEHGFEPGKDAKSNCRYSGYEISIGGYWDEHGFFWATDINNLKLEGPTLL